METDNNSISNYNESDAPIENLETVPNELVAIDNDFTEEHSHSHRHHREYGFRRYKMFSNHSSWNDMPHTNTSF